MKLHFTRWGSSGPHWIFLHGMGGVGQLWRPLAASLEDSHVIAAPDQRGHGKSQIISDGRGFSTLDYGQDLLETFGSEGEFSVLGHSMGVRSAVAFAKLSPERVKRLVLIDLGFSGPAGGGLGDTLYDFLSRTPMEFNSSDEAKEYLLREGVETSMNQYLFAVLQMKAKPGEKLRRFPFDREALLKTLEEAKVSKVGPWLKEFAKTGKEVWVLRGKESGVWSHDDYLKEKKDFMEFPNVQFQEWENSGHGLPFEVRDRLSRFLVEIELTKA